jgi:hypothetical protein
LFLQAHVFSDSPGQTNTRAHGAITGGTTAFFRVAGEVIETRPTPGDVFAA